MLLMVDNWSVFLGWKNLRNRFSVSGRNRDKMASSEWKFPNVLRSVMSSLESLDLSALERPNSILITDRALTADKTCGSQFRRKVASYRPDVTGLWMQKKYSLHLPWLIRVKLFFLIDLEQGVVSDQHTTSTELTIPPLSLNKLVHIVITQDL